MNYTDRQGTDKKHRETGKKERKKRKQKMVIGTQVGKKFQKPPEGYFLCRTMYMR